MWVEMVFSAILTASVVQVAVMLMYKMSAYVKMFAFGMWLRVQFINLSNTVSHNLIVK